MTLERSLSVRPLQNTNACILLQGGCVGKLREYLPSLKVILINTQNGDGEETRLAKCLFSTHDPQKLPIRKKAAVSGRWCSLASQPRLRGELSAN